MQADTLDFSANWGKRFGYPPITEKISRSIPLSANVHHQDMPAFIKIMQDTRNGVPYAETEFRIRSSFGEYKWCRIRATTQYDSQKIPVKAVGVIVDIDEEKNRSTMLLEAAQRDALTQLYNKVATKGKVEKMLFASTSMAQHALMIIDIDNFKGVNDRYGHHCGDAVLSNMAKALKSLFRATDVVGRIGGDEFLVFMANVDDMQVVTEKANEIVTIFSKMPTEINSTLSCSVGISLFKRDGEDYMSLYRNADKALYGVKNDGKVDYAFYEKERFANVTYSTMPTAVNEKIDSEAGDYINLNLVQQTFRVLYEAEDIRAGIGSILKTIGKAYGVSRAYVFENSPDGRYCSNTFEWCNEGIESQIDNLQNLCYETDLDGFFDIYDENGLFYCQDIGTLNPQLQSVLAEQEVVAVLQCLIKDGRDFKGYVGFDECGNNRYWTKEEMATLTLVANILSTFLIKQQLHEELNRLKQQPVEL